MLPKLETPSWKDFWLLLGGILLYTLPVYFLTRVFPSLEGGHTQAVLSTLAVMAAAYPAARKLGFRFGLGGEYVKSLVPELLPALKYYLLLLALLYAGDHLYRLLLAPWDLPWTNTLLFWNEASSNPAVSDSRVGAALENPLLLLPVYFVSVCVLPPLVEEFLLRRWLYAALRARLPAWAAILANGALFGLLHGKDFMATAAHGFFFCWVYERTGRLQTPILVHAYGNLVGLAMVLAAR